MLNVACVRKGNDYGPEPFNILFDMVRRNLPYGTGGRFICYTDERSGLDPSILVRPLSQAAGAKEMFLPVDCVIVRPLDSLLDGEGARISIYDGTFPQDAQIVLFPEKKPSECNDWVKHVWKIGGGTTAELKFITNIESGGIQANIRSAIAMACKWFEPVAAHDGTAIIVGSGPSLRDDLLVLRCMAQDGQIFALNGSPAYLHKFGITPDFHVLLDAHPDVIDMVSPQIRMTRYYASQCDPPVLDAARDELISWHGGGMAMEAISDETFKHIVGGGSTVASRAMILAYGLGYRKLHLFGLDSSYDGEIGHAFDQFQLEATLKVTCGDEVFSTTAQMLGQAEDFKVIIPDLLQAQCEITVHGGGLLKAIATQMFKENA